MSKQEFVAKRKDIYLVMGGRETGDNTSLGDSVPRLILKTLRWLPSNANGDLLAEKLLEVPSVYRSLKVMLLTGSL